MNTISVIGGDLRQTTVARLLRDDGFDVSLYGFDSGVNTYCIKKAGDISSAAQSDILIMPLPLSCDNETVNAPFSGNKIYISDILENVRKDTILLGGRINDYLKGEFSAYSLNWRDYLLREEMAIQNAVPTSEGAINIAITETPETIAESSCMVLGYGRIGKVLCRMLSSLGASVTAAARSCSDLAWIRNEGFTPIHTNDIASAIGSCDIIFNTIPSVILDRRILSVVSKDALIIDLSSKPGGVDFDTARELNLRVIWALSLPGKIAPVTAGKIIKNTVMNILNEMGV
ncbi:MAG: dipicolinate synthase subunit DpsA [Oscillospiraceae bacterium]|nr:dipicolinate synthase subunit DpsA [Oscillospiraceae bacterium]